MKIGIALELGRNLGHVLRVAAIGSSLRERGHDVVFLARADGGHGEERLTVLDFEVDLVPPPTEFVETGEGIVSHADILLASGYARPECFRSYLEGWKNAITARRLDTVLADHAPTSLIAATDLAMPSLSIGCGFTTPPRTFVQPALVEGFVPRSRLRFPDEHVTSVVRNVVGTDYARSIANVGDFFARTRSLLVTLPELDPFRERRADPYLGPINGSRHLLTTDWPVGIEARILVYSRPGMPALDHLMERARADTNRWIFVVPGIDRPERMRTNSVDVYSEPIDLTNIIETCDACVNYGSLGLVSQSLLAGVPSLCLPTHPEQLSNARRLSEAGFGRYLRLGDESSASRALDDLLADDVTRTACRAYAATRARYDDAIGKVVASVETLRSEAV